jgi:5-methylcytosine-specific restriction endonuclease McrA
MFRTLEESNAYMADELRKARDADAADLAKAKAYFKQKGNTPVFANDHAMKFAYFKELADYNLPDKIATVEITAQLSDPVEPNWRIYLDLQDLNELRETAKMVSTKISGNKQEVCDAIVTKLAVYEEMYKTMSKNELKEVCQSRGIKGCSTLAKEPLIDRLIRSHFEIKKKITAKFVDEIPTAVAIKIDPTSRSHRIVDAKTKAAEAEVTKAAKVAKVKAAEAEVAKAAKVKAAEAEVAEAAEVAKAKAAETKKKGAIPKKVKTDVWNTYIGADINKHRCLCCKKTLISNTEFDVGHVVSESSGGTLEIGNLRPICAACNHSMGTRNMVEFVKMFGYYIG